MSKGGDGQMRSRAGSAGRRRTTGSGGGTDESGTPASRRSPAEPRIRKNFRLSQAKIERAKQVLGTRTDTETIEAALDLATFGVRLAEGIDAMKGFRWRPLAEADQA